MSHPLQRRAPFMTLRPYSQISIYLGAMRVCKVFPAPIREPEGVLNNIKKRDGKCKRQYLFKRQLKCPE
jgi:hypothetical protein